MASTTAPTPIDPRGPRTNQAVLATAMVVAFVLQQRWLVPLFAVVLFLGAAFGPKWGPVLRFYGTVIRPRLAPPTEIEDPRPPRFAASVGVVFLTAATLAFVADANAVGWTLALLVAALAALAASTGICVGCEMYVWWVRVRGGVRIVATERDLPTGAGEGHRHHRSRRDDHLALPRDFLDGRPVWVVFTTEYCAVCPRVVAEIESARPAERVLVVDVAERPDLAAAHRVRRAPTVLRADVDGSVLAKLAGTDAVRNELDSLRAVTTAV